MNVIVQYVLLVMYLFISTYECYCTVCGSIVCIFVFKLFFLGLSSFLMLQLNFYYPFCFRFKFCIFAFHFVCSVICIVSPYLHVYYCAV